MTHQLLHSSQMSGFCTSAANCWLNCCLECTLSTCRFNLSLRPKLKQIADNCFQHFLPFYLYLGLILSWRQNIFASKSDYLSWHVLKINLCDLTWCCIVCRRKVFLWGGHFYSDGSCDPAVWRCNHRSCKSSSLYPPRCGHCFFPEREGAPLTESTITLWKSGCTEFSNFLHCPIRRWREKIQSCQCKV